MTEQEMVLLFAFGWLLALSLVVLLLVRQLGLITLRLDMSSRTVPLEADGLLIGESLPRHVTDLLPPQQDELHYILILSANCEPCLRIASEVATIRGADRMIAVVPGDAEFADVVVSRLPFSIDVVRGTEATTVADGLGVSRTPSVFQIERGVITGKAWILSIDDFQRLVDAHAQSLGPELAISAAN